MRMRLFKCSECQYELQGLAREGRCPECGASIHDSIQSELQRDYQRVGFRQYLPAFIALGVYAVVVGLVIPILLGYDRYCVLWSPLLFILTGAYLSIATIVLRIRLSCSVPSLVVMWIACGLVACLSYGVHQSMCNGFGV